MEDKQRVIKKRWEAQVLRWMIDSVVERIDSCARSRVCISHCNHHHRHDGDGCSFGMRDVQSNDRDSCRLLMMTSARER